MSLLQTGFMEFKDITSIKFARKVMRIEYQNKERTFFGLKLTSEKAYLILQIYNNYKRSHNQSFNTVRCAHSDAVNGAG